MADNSAFNDPPSSAGTLQASLSNSDTQPNTQSTSSSVFKKRKLSDGEAGLNVQQDQDLDTELNQSSVNGTNAEDGSEAVPSAAAAQTTETNGINNMSAMIEPRIPQQKDTSLREFMSNMDEYAPLIPDAVTDYYLTLAGLPPPPETDRRLARLLALATQKFIADIAADAYQYSRLRSTNTTSNNPLTGLGGAAGLGTNLPQMNGGGEGGEGGAGKGKKDTGKAPPLGGPRAGFGGGPGGGGQGRTVLTMEDLGMAVGEYGVNVKRGDFYR